MSVLIPNTRLGLRRRVEGDENSHGEETSPGYGSVVGLYDGLAKEGADGVWVLGLDPALMPVRQYDLVIGMGGESWVVNSAAVLRNAADPTVDWVRCQAARRSVGGTEPPGAWFVARYEDYVEPDPGEGDPILVNANLWTGYGPPPEPNLDTFPAKPGDEYIDLNTGIVYELGGA